MKPIKPHTSGLTAGILFLFVCAMSIFSCNNPDTKKNVTTTQPESVKPSSTMSFPFPSLDTLMLSVSDYNDLKATFPSSQGAQSKLIVQFYFDKSLPGNPSLIAYASKPGNQFKVGTTGPVSKILQIGGHNALQLPDEFVLGDQQIRFADIDGILPDPNNGTILFIPIIKPGEKNVRYKIIAQGAANAAADLTTQPSPPANAN